MSQFWPPRDLIEQSGVKVRDPLSRLSCSLSEVPVRSGVEEVIQWVHPKWQSKVFS